MSKNRQAIMEGRDAFESTNDVATFRKVGHRFGRTYLASREDRREVHYHYNVVLDSLGRSAAGEEFHGHDYRKVSMSMY